VTVVTVTSVLFASLGSPSAVIVASLVTVPVAFAAVLTTSVTVFVVSSGNVPRSHMKTVVESVAGSHEAPWAFVVAETALVWAGTGLSSCTSVAASSPSPALTMIVNVIWPPACTGSGESVMLMETSPPLCAAAGAAVSKTVARVRMSALFGKCRYAR
jgi:hypothetical protein